MCTGKKSHTAPQSGTALSQHPHFQCACLWGPTTVIPSTQCSTYCCLPGDHSNPGSGSMGWVHLSGMFSKMTTAGIFCPASTHPGAPIRASRSAPLWMAPSISFSIDRGAILPLPNILPYQEAVCPMKAMSPPPFLTHLTPGTERQSPFFNMDLSLIT